MIHLDMNENRCTREIQLPHNDYQRFYPRYTECDLINIISDIHRIDSENIYILNGIDEGIWLLLKHIQQYGVELYIDIPNYCGILEGIKVLDIKTVNNHHRDYYDVASTIRLLEKCPDKVKAAYFCSPINPLGTSIDRLREIIEICRKKQILVFLDQAYIEFCAFDDSLYEYSKFDNLIIARTFSKAYGLAGIRC